MLEKLENKILAKIKNDNLAPRPYWHFWLKEFLLWFFGALALFVGAAAVSVMIYLTYNSDGLFYHRASGGIGAWLLLSLPYFWLIFLALFIWLLYFNLKHIKGGYRYPVFLIVTASIIASVIFGLILYALGFGEKIDGEMGRKAPMYDRVFNPNIDLWSRPEDGRLAGLVISVVDEEHFVLADRQRGKWNISHEESEENEDEENRTNQEEDERLIIVGQPVHVVGRVGGPQEFIAEKILIMKPGREFFKRLNDDLLPPPPFPGPGQSPHGCLQGSQSNFVNILDKYPEFKQAFLEDLSANKEMIKAISAEDPEFFLSLQALGFDPVFLQSLSK
jgi:hypothetical protein